MQKPAVMHWLSYSQYELDLILLEVVLSDMSGFDVCRKLKQSELTEAIPVIFVSQTNKVKDRVHGLDLGAIDFIVKPYNKKELLAKIRNALKHKAYQDKLIGNGQIDSHTGFWNRKHFFLRLHDIFFEAQRFHRCFSLLWVGIDGFSSHSESESFKERMKVIIAMIWANCRVSDIPGYQIDGKFALILPETDQQTAIMLGERLRAIAASRWKDHDDSLL